MLKSTEINLRQSFLISALLTLGMDKANSGLYLLDASSMPCQLWQEQCLQTFLSVPWLRATGLDCLENRCWGTFLPSHYGRGSIPTPLVLLVHSAEMKMSGYKTKDLSENWYSITSESPQEKPYIELSGSPTKSTKGLCRGFLNNIWSTMYFNRLVVSKHGCCQNHWCQALGLEESHLVEIGWSPQASMFCNHQLMMREVLNPLWIVVCIGETTQVARFISSWMFIVCPYCTRTHSRQWEYHGKRMMRSLPWM